MALDGRNFIMKGKTAFILTIALSLAAPAARALDVEEKAPDFALKTLEGEEVSLSGVLDKKAAMLVFWATWCPNCEKEIPSIKEITKKFAENIEVLAINVDVNDSPAKAATYKEEYSIGYTMLYDKGTKVSGRYGVIGTPTIFVVDVNGIIRYKGAALPEISDIESNMAKLVGE